MLTKTNSFRKTKIEEENINKALDNVPQKLNKYLKSLGK